jgi:hypothetical protein
MFEDCPICLDEMQPTDYEHLLQCERHCGFNMCKSCIESLLASSKDDFQEASDGNRHVKVYLHCPNCRSDLSHTIRDTLLLRKADEITYHKKKDKSEWTPSQLRLEKVLHTPAVQQAIQQARKLEAEYMGRDDFDGGLILEEEEEYIEEWGVEADFDVGVHESFREPRPPSPVRREEAVQVDPTLFAGLDHFLTEDQRKEVTELMTSGDPSLLADAAEILHTVARQLHNPKPSVPPMPSKTDDSAVRRRKSLARRSSVFQLIQEAEVAHIKHDNPKEKNVNDACNVLNPHSRVVQHRQLERELRIHADFQKRFPIPVRMPKAIDIDLTQPFDMEFVDYTWGGKSLNNR